jgi:hypothetical protein
MASLKARIGNGSDPSETQAANETETKPLAPNAIISVPQGDSAAETPSAKAPRTKAPEDGSASSLVLFAVTLAIFWLGAAIAFLWGYYGVPGLVALPPHLIAFAGAATLIPPLFFITCAYAFGKAQTMSNAALALRASAEKLSTVDETVVEKAQNLGRAVRRELDTLNIGLDAAYGRLRTLESVLEDRIAQLDDANARAEVKTQAVAQRLNDERETIESIAELLDQVAARASETLAGRAAQLKTLVEQAGGELKSAGQLLDTQADRSCCGKGNQPRRVRSWQAGTSAHGNERTRCAPQGGKHQIRRNVGNAKRRDGTRCGTSCGRGQTVRRIIRTEHAKSGHGLGGPE